MIIPIKCFSCGNVLVDKYLHYVKEVNKKKLAQGKEHDDIEYLTTDIIKKTAEGEGLDDLGLTKTCCRRHMLTHVDIV